jgi:exoribonuclease II
MTKKATKAKKSTKKKKVVARIVPKKTKEANEPDFIVEELFKRETGKVKLIQFGEKFKSQSDEAKIKYLIELASSLNHAAQQIQKERDELNKLLFLKEDLLVKCKESRSAARVMIQKQIINENEKQQELLKENQQLRKEIEELKNADKYRVEN